MKPVLSLLINDVTLLCLLMLKIYFDLKESVRHKHEDSKVDYSIGKCCFDRLKETPEERGLREGSMLHRASFFL